MSRAIAALLVAGLALAGGALVTGQSAGVHRSTHYDYRVTTVVDGLEHPWSIAFLPGGDMLVTERPGRLRVVRNGQLLAAPVPGVPDVLAEGQGGLLEVMPHPEFSSNRLLYLSYSKPASGDRPATTAVGRGRFENDRLTNFDDIFVAVSEGRGHFGSKLAFDGKGYLFITIGDRMAPPVGNLEAHPAQDLTNHHGVTVRLHDDGRVPSDNPFVNRAGARPEIWSYGHRNAQGMAFHPETGDLWQNEHGPQGGDELNLIKPGVNYGWPVIGYGVNYRTGAIIHQSTHREGMEQPAHIWVPSIGISGLMVYTGDRFPQWKGSIFVGGLAGEQLARLTLDGQQVVNEETLVQRMGRIREVRQGPDGLIYLAIDNRDGQKSPILRVEPVARTTDVR
jgi:glucose/arabinose dehydrogenase